MKFYKEASRRLVIIDDFDGINYQLIFDLLWKEIYTDRTSALKREILKPISEAEFRLSIIDYVFKADSFARLFLPIVLRRIKIKLQ